MVILRKRAYLGPSGAGAAYQIPYITPIGAVKAVQEYDITISRPEISTSDPTGYQNPISGPPFGTPKIHPLFTP